MALLAQIAEDIANFPEYRRWGRVAGVNGMLIELGGMPREVTVGSRCEVITQERRRAACEIVGFRGGRALAMPFTALDGIGLGCRVELATGTPVIYPHESWLGRVINAMGEPIDGKGPLIEGRVAYPLRAAPPPAHACQRVHGKVVLGVRAINTFLTCCRGQRMGIFAGSGVGKSTLMSMFARHTTADATVIGLVGERGREVQEFIADDLGAEGLARSIVVVATSDESPLMRRQAAYLTMAMAEFLRDRDQDVLCLIDSVTRFATAQREIGLAAGEPPTTKGYTPTVFAELPKLLERAGPGTGQGSITGLFSVLVEGDDHNEPIADATRAILDGHIVLDRAIAERGRYPAINILRSISRMMPQCNSDEESALIATARGHVAVYDDMAELIRLGAYRRGSDQKVDEAMRFYPAIETFLAQAKDERAEFGAGYATLANLLAAPLETS
ncbi:MAG TPA: flagellar protein export ATPase FliI [Stellaceae bacterium]|nr:flagellar protein export ATPase FliI [Stellaceae bacterium]